MPAAALAALGVVVLAARVGSLAYDAGHQVIDLTVKGDATRRFALPPAVNDALDGYLADRGPTGGDAPLFATAAGRPLDQPGVYRMLQRVARAAGIPHAAQLSPHSIRRSMATLALNEGVPLHEVQDYLGHADPRTTRRYDLGRNRLERTPAYRLLETLMADMRAEAGDVADAPPRAGASAP